MLPTIARPLSQSPGLEVSFETATECRNSLWMSNPDGDVQATCCLLHHTCDHVKNQHLLPLTTALFEGYVVSVPRYPFKLLEYFGRGFSDGLHVCHSRARNHGPVQTHNHSATLPCAQLKGMYPSVYGFDNWRHLGDVICWWLHLNHSVTIVIQLIVCRNQSDTWYLDENVSCMIPGWECVCVCNVRGCNRKIVMCVKFKLAK